MPEPHTLHPRDAAWDLPPCMHDAVVLGPDKGQAREARERLENLTFRFFGLVDLLGCRLFNPMRTHLL